MKYNILNDNYKSFSVYKLNVLKPRSYFIPFKSYDALLKTDIRTERYNSDMVTLLSGEWDFKYYSSVSKIPSEFDTEAVSFDKIAVPSCWQFTGYEPPYYVNTRYQFKPNPPEIPEDCSVGVYRKCFEIDDVNANYTLTFLGAAGALDVFVNGKFVGYSEGSHNTSEFELNEFVVEGNNELVAVLHKFSNGTYLECQDMFRNNGIFRDVLLTKTGNNSIYDFEVKTAYNGSYSLSVLPSLKLTEECVLTAKIEELELSKSVNVNTEYIDKIEFLNVQAEEWSAEIPKLYTLVLTLSKEGKAIEVIRRKIGFRHIEIKGNVFLFNNKKIKLLGVNHHDTDPKKGFVMTVEDMERDIAICKQYNVNCIRTSHYPPDAIFLDLCDEYGIYVVDEADIETHGCQIELHRPGACSHNPQWQGHFWDRVYRMFERDKNHPCVTMWSLGNESWGYKNHDYCYEQLKALSDIPIHYEGVIKTRRFAYDVISQMYPWQGKYHKVASGKGLPLKYYKKPYFLCEYAHAMGVGAGELETYVSDFLRADNLMGGCIWEFADHAVYHENGSLEYTYGGDHGEEKHDKNFCVDGLFYPDRKPHAGALQMKNCYRPVRAEKQGDSYVFTNLNYFKSVNFAVKWNNEKTGGSFNINIKPRKTQRVSLENSAYVVFRYYDGDNEVASECHYSYGYHATCVGIDAPDAPSMNLNVYKDSITLLIDGIPLILGASLFRAPIDNDMYLNKVWEKYLLKTEKLKVLEKTENGNTVNINAVIENERHSKLAKINLAITCNNEGVTLNLNCISAKMIPFTPRFGLTVQLPSEYDNVSYFGFGERQNLPDFKEHTVLAEWSMKVDEMHEDYIKPQESSMRCGVSWATLTDEKGKGLFFEAVNKPFIFSADRFTSQQCASAMHREELELQDFTYLHIDSYQLGAGSAACGPPPTKAYRKNNVKGETLSIIIRRV